jgi:RNA polymerase sigma-70 factor (ECF subfamily)
MTAHATGSDTAWVREALERFERPLIAYAARLTGDPDRARDVVQDVFLKLCVQDRDRVGPHLAEWLFTVCRNRALDVLRKEGRMGHLSEDQARVHPGHDPAPGELLERREEAALVLRMLDDLPPGQQEVIRLKFQNGFSYKEISHISGYSVSNVGFLIHTGLKTIRGRLAVGRTAPASS